jgi:hypothetical protein
MVYRAAPGEGRCDCTLEWWEKSTDPYFALPVVNMWSNLYPAQQNATTIFTNWKNYLAAPEPALNQSFTVTLPDQPMVQAFTPTVWNRKLEFWLGVRSGSRALCNQDLYGEWQYASQVLKTQKNQAGENVPNLNGSQLNIGPKYSIPGS